jgi:CheY-like chemotaxis protein
MPTARRPSAPSDHGETPLKTLIVDDHLMNRLLMRTLAEELGCAVAEAETGEAAAKLARRTAFDLIIMDRNMPGGSGDEAAQQIRAAGASRRAFMVRWSTDPPDPRRARLYDGALPKPIIYPPLVETIVAARRLASREAQRRNHRKRAPEPAVGERLDNKSR